MPDLSAVLPGVGWLDAAFTGELFPFSSGRGVGEFLHLLTNVASACWSCCGLLSKSPETSSEARLLLEEATCLSDIRPVSFPWKSALINWRWPPCQTRGPVEHPQPGLRVLAQEMQPGMQHREKKQDPVAQSCALPWACVRVRGVMWGEGARARPQ